MRIPFPKKLHIIRTPLRGERRDVVGRARQRRGAAHQHGDERGPVRRVLVAQRARAREHLRRALARARAQVLRYLLCPTNSLQGFRCFKGHFKVIDNNYLQYN